jgi:hypothetical protein
MPHVSKEARRAYNKRYYHDGPGKAKAKTSQLALKLETFEAYGGAYCVQCGFADHRALNLDHIGGGGEIDRNQPGSRTIYYRLKREGFPAGFQVLCANCNSIKKYTHNEFTGPRGS